MTWKVWRLMFYGSFLTLLVFPGMSSRHAWENPGCHKIGHTRKISIPNCVEFDITTNACRGFCESYAIPSTPETIRANLNQVITSHGHCCNIMDSEDIHVKVMCLQGPKDLVFKSAKTCECFHCQKDY